MRWLFRDEGNKNFSLNETYTPLIEFISIGSWSQFSQASYFLENPKTDLWSQIIWILHCQKNGRSENWGSFTMTTEASSSGASFLAWQRRARNASNWWWTARDHGKGTDGGRSAVSPVVSFPPSFARTSKERRLGTRQWQRNVLVLLVMRKIEEKTKKKKKRICPWIYIFKNLENKPAQADTTYVQKTWQVRFKKQSTKVNTEWYVTQLWLKVGRHQHRFS